MKRFWCWFWGHKLRFDRPPRPGFDGGLYRCDRCHLVEKVLLTRRDVWGRFR